MRIARESNQTLERIASFYERPLTMSDNSSSIKETDRKIKRSHIPTNSMFYNKIIPIILIAMAMMMVTFILIAVGVLLGIVPFR